MKRSIPYITNLYGLLCLVCAVCYADSAPRQLESRQAENLRSWSITLEEPTGIYRRDREIVSLRYAFGPGEARKGELRIITPDGQVIRPQVQVATTHADGSIRLAEILFPATLIPGERPVFQLVSGLTSKESVAPNVAPELSARAIGVGRYEIANSHYAVIINLGREGTEPAIVAAWHKQTGERKMLNLIDTSPDVEEHLAHGVRSAGIGTFALPRSGNEQLQRSGHFDQVEIVEPGPYRLRVRMKGRLAGGRSETWEFTAVAGSPVLSWRTEVDRAQAGERLGFFFSSISATPYEPFNRVFDGEETRFPDGWETDNPPDRPVGPQRHADLPGGHFLYYNRQEDYGALGILELDPRLDWHGIGGRQFLAVRELKEGGHSSEIALSFPRWRGTVTIVEARSTYRRHIQPILAVMRAGSVPGSLADRTDEVREPTTIEKVAAGAVVESGRDIQQVDLGGTWRATWTEKSEGEKKGFHLPGFNDREWREVSVPGSAHTQFLDPSKIHTREAEWVSAKEWWYRRSLSRPVAAPNDRIWLWFEATDYHADVYLNGELIARHEGYIDPWSVEVTGQLQADRPNILAVRVWTPVSYYWRHRPYTIKGSYGAVDQKPDKITATGITRPVNLTVTGAATIDAVAVDTRLNRDGSAEVVVDLTFEAAGTTAVDLLMTLRPDNFSGPEAWQLRSTLTIEPGRTDRQYRIHIDKPELWWTWDHGKPNLYQLRIDLQREGRLSDRRVLRIGIREIEQIDWKFYLNGRRLFVRGTNYYYNLFLSEMSRKGYERDLDLIRQMNVNMIRLHCHFSNPEFYDLTDELGILVFQDYLEAWYPEDRAFSLKAAGLYDPLIRYVRNHASLAVWATSDEESLENYRDLTKHLEPRLFLHDPQRRPVVRSTGRYGDAHVYEGWYGGTIWEYTRVREKFISELGATALPNYDSLIRFLPNHWPIREHTDDWVFHKLQITEAMRAWGSPEGKTLQEYIPQTQEYVARLFQLAIERMRRLKYNPSGGILHFHAVDIWPSVTMAALDYYRQPTKSYYTVRSSFQLVLPSFAYDRDLWKSGETVTAELWLINDRWESIDKARLSWRLLDRAGNPIGGQSSEAVVALPADSSFRWNEVRARPERPGRYTLRATIRDSAGVVISENDYEFEVR